MLFMYSVGKASSMKLIQNDIYDSSVFRNYTKNFNVLNNALHLSQLIMIHSFRNGIGINKRITQLNSAPKISLDSNCKKIVLDDKIEFDADSRYHTVPEVLLSLGYLTGNGFFKSNFNYSELENVDKKDWIVARSFASEIMDANIHKKYIQRKFPTHDDTKTPVFCYLLAIGLKSEAIDLHHNAIRKVYYGTENPDVLDTNHHLNDGEILSAIINLKFDNKGNSIIPAKLEELLMDQASFAQRIFKLDELNGDFGNVEDSQLDYLNEGIYLPESGVLMKEDGLDLTDDSLSDEFVDFLKEQEIFQKDQFKVVWNEWKRANIDFANYWEGLYGKHYEKFVHPFSSK